MHCSCPGNLNLNLYFLILIPMMTSSSVFPKNWRRHSIIKLTAMPFDIFIWARKWQPQFPIIIMLLLVEWRDCGTETSSAHQLEGTIGPNRIPIQRLKMSNASPFSTPSELKLTHLISIDILVHSNPNEDFYLYSVLYGMYAAQNGNN